MLRAAAALLLATMILPPDPALRPAAARASTALLRRRGGGAEPDPLSWAVLHVGPMLAVDRLLAAYDAGAHVVDDLFATKLAFVALLGAAQEGARRPPRCPLSAAAVRGCRRPSR